MNRDGLETAVAVIRDMHPADEEKDIEPRTDYEEFYLLAALEFGVPNRIEGFAVQFYAMFREWTRANAHLIGKANSHPAAALLQYILWYEREERRIRERSYDPHTPI